MFRVAQTTPRRPLFGTSSRAAVFFFLSALALAARAGEWYDLATPITRFAALGEAARREGLPILLVVSGPDCAYCKRQRAEVLEPLGRAGWFDGRAFVREYDWRQHEQVEGFDGLPVRGPIFIDRYKVFATPTVLFLDPDGEPLIAPIAGYNNRVEYTDLLEHDLTASQALLREPSRGWQYPREALATQRAPHRVEVSP